ncbi:MAG: glycosyltransferase [Actinobacteria bacterium]|nr:glycosyltransferase [Actinomycetota bacterium]
MIGRGHILFVDDYRHATIGGGERHLLRVAKGCQRAGWRTGVVCVPGSGLEKNARAAGHEVWPVPTGRHLPRARRELRALFERLSPDIVHAHGFYATMVSASAARRAGVARVLTTVHTMPSAPLDLYPGVRGWFEFRLRSTVFRRQARSIDRFVCVVPAVRDELLRIGVAESKLEVIENGISDPACGVRRSPVAERGEIVRVGSVGRFEQPKGYEHFIAAAAIVARERSDVEFRLVGDGTLRAALMAQAERLGIGDRFEFAGWSDDPIGEIAGMDIYVVSSVTDTTNLTVLEAMGLSRPVIATDVGGISDAVADGVNGYLVPSRREDLMALRILELVDSPALRKSMGPAGRRRFEERFTEAHMVERHLELYERLTMA